MRMGANPSVSYRRLPPTLKAKRVGTFRTISSRILPEIAHVARFSDGRFYGAIFSPPLTCGVVGCDIRPVRIWYSKTVQHTLFLANSDFKLYDRGDGRQETTYTTGTLPRRARWHEGTVPFASGYGSMSTTQAVLNPFALNRFSSVTHGARYSTHWRSRTTTSDYCSICYT